MVVSSQLLSDCNMCQSHKSTKTLHFHLDDNQTDKTPNQNKTSCLTSDSPQSWQQFANSLCGCQITTHNHVICIIMRRKGENMQYTQFWMTVFL